MEEEADPVGGTHPAEFLRDGDEMVVVDPDEIVPPDVGRHRVRETGVHPEVAPVVEPVVRGVPHPVVEKGPQGTVGVAGVVLVVVVRSEVDGREGEPVHLAEGGRAGALAHLSAPSEPHPGVAPQGGVHGDREPALRALSILGARHAHPIRDDHEAAHRAKVQGRLRRTALLMIPTRE